MSAVLDKAGFDLTQQEGVHLAVVHVKDVDIDGIAALLAQDKVVLVQDASPDQADRMMLGVASVFDLASELEVQAGFAAIHGHRENIGRFFMSVNNREDYGFIPPHSEGSSRMNMQLSAFYCFENTTDGGETVLWGSSENEAAWSSLQEFKYKVAVKRENISKTEAAMLKMMFEIDATVDRIAPEDSVVSLKDEPVAGVFRYGVLSPLRKCYSRVLGIERYVCWDTVGSVDRDIAHGFAASLHRSGLLKGLTEPTAWAARDSSNHRKVWSSGVELGSLFNRVIIRKLRQGELILMNNMTWAHSACGWTPGTGVRRLAASFA